MVSDAVCESRVNKIHDEMNLIRETTNANALILHRIDKAINGNGKPGLINQFTDTKWKMWIAIILIGGGGIGSGVGFLNMLRTVLKL